jgi:hypothetical protein
MGHPEVEVVPVKQVLRFAQNDNQKSKSKSKDRDRGNGQGKRRLGGQLFEEGGPGLFAAHLVAEAAE